MDKFILKSKTIMGAVVMLLPVLAGIFGFSFTESDSALITTSWDAVISAVGAVIVVIGRFTAKDKIKLNPFA